MQSTDSAHQGNSHLKLMAKAAGLYLAAVLFSKIASYGFRWVGARLGTAEYGEFSMAFGVFEIAVSLALLGVDAAVARFIVDESLDHPKAAPSYNSFWFSLKVAICSSIFVSAVLLLLSGWLASAVFHTPSLWLSIVLFGLALPFFVVVLVFVAAARGRKHVEYEAGAKFVAESALRPIIAFVAIAFGLGALGLTTAVFSTAILVFVLCAYWASRLFPQDWISSIMSSRQPEGFFKFSIPLYASNILSTVITNASLFSLGLLIGASQAGVFSALMPLAIFIMTPALGILSIFVSVGSELFALGKTAESQKLYHSLTKGILMLTLPLAFVLAFFSREALTFLYVIDYSAGATALSILAIAYLLYSTFTPSINYLNVLKRTDLYLKNLVASFAVVFLCIFLLVPSYGVTGAAVSFAAGLLVQAFLPVLEVKKYAKLSPISGTFLRTLAAGLLALIPLYFLNGAYGLRGFYRVVFGALIFCASYAILLFFLRAFDCDDIELLKAVERKSGFRLGIFRNFLRKLYFGKNV